MHIPILHVVICCNQPDNFERILPTERKQDGYLATNRLVSVWLAGSPHHHRTHPSRHQS